MYRYSYLSTKDAGGRISDRDALISKQINITTHVRHREGVMDVVGGGG